MISRPIALYGYVLILGNMGNMRYYTKHKKFALSLPVAKKCQSLSIGLPISSLPISPSGVTR